MLRSDTLPAVAARGTVLRFRADRWSVTLVLFCFAAHALVYACATPVVAVVATLPLWLLGILVAPLNHHHQHVNVFHAAWANRVYDLVLALQSGIGPYTWTLHHNLGHHLNYLTQPPGTPADESHWARSDGSVMGRLEYSFHLFFDHHRDVHKVGRRHPKIYRSFWAMRLPLYAIVALLAWHDPWNFTFAVALPAALALLHTCWATYEHHAGQHPTSHFDATVNRIHPLYNALSWNLGYHTAHHLRPGVHWSELPALHSEIAGKIPAHQVLTTFW